MNLYDKTVYKKSFDFEFGAVRKNANLVNLEKTLHNKYLVAEIGVDTDENEPSEICAFGRWYM